MFYSFLCCLTKSELLFFVFFFCFCFLWLLLNCLRGQQNSLYDNFHFSLISLWFSGREYMTHLYLKILENCMSPSREQILLCAYTIWYCAQISVSSKFPSFTFSTQSCVVLYFFGTRLPHWRKMGLIVFSLSPRNMRCCDLLVFTVI